MTLALALVLVGFAFILAEVFIPSLGLLGLIAGVCILTGDVLAFEHGGSTVGFAFIGAELVLIPLLIRQAFRWLPHLPFGRRMLLAGPSTTPAPAVENLAHLIGAEGLAVTDLRPSGTARFGSERISVVARTGMIQQGTPIIVLGVEGPEVRVAPAPSAVDPHRRTP